MKKIKFIICFFLLFFCLALNGEMYQLYLDGFTGGVYYFSAAKMFGEDETDIEQKRKVIKELSDKNNCNVFCVEKQLSNSSQAKIVVFTPDENTKEIVKNNFNIAPGEYKSLFSGVTEVEFEDFSKTPESTQFYFFGEIESIRNIKKDFVKKGFNCGMVKKDEEANLKWLVMGAWLMFGLLLLFLTWFDIQFQKKENLILISLGKSNGNIVLKNVFTDTAVFISLYLITTLILNKITYLFYLKEITIPFFLGIIIINSLIYLTIYRYDLKKSLSKSSFSNSILSNCYLLKAVSMIITVVVLSANILVIAENGNLLSKQDAISQYEDYSFLKVYSENYYEANEETNRIIDKVKAEIIYREYINNDVAFSVSSFNNNKYLISNINAINVLSDIKEIETLIFTKDYYILLPDSYDSYEETIAEADEYIKSCFLISKDANYDVITYSGNKNILFFKDNAKREAVINFDTADTPVIILCNFSEEVLPDKNQSEYELTAYNSIDFNNMMFNFSVEDEVYYEEKYNLDEKGIKIGSVGVIQNSNYAWAVLARTVILNTAVSMLMFLLEILMMITIVKLEYITNAVEISLKKVLGYSILGRNKTVFFLNAFSVFIGVFTSVIIALMLESNIWFMFLAVGGVVLILEYFAICYYITKLEKTSVPKILKGGCL